MGAFDKLRQALDADTAEPIENGKLKQADEEVDAGVYNFSKDDTDFTQDIPVMQEYETEYEGNTESRDALVEQLDIDINSTPQHTDTQTPADAQNARRIIATTLAVNDLVAGDLAKVSELLSSSPTPSDLTISIYGNTDKLKASELVLQLLGMDLLKRGASLMELDDKVFDDLVRVIGFFGFDKKTATRKNAEAVQHINSFIESLHIPAIQHFVDFTQILLGDKEYEPKKTPAQKKETHGEQKTTTKAKTKSKAKQKATKPKTPAKNAKVAKDTASILEIDNSNLPPELANLT
jgi:hypothetical protein